MGLGMEGKRRVSNRPGLFCTLKNAEGVFSSKDMPSTRHPKRNEGSRAHKARCIAQLTLPLSGKMRFLRHSFGWLWVDFWLICPLALSASALSSGEHCLLSAPRSVGRVAVTPAAWTIRGRCPSLYGWCSPSFCPPACLLTCLN